MAMRFGLLGTGHWAAQTQAEGLRAHPDAELVGVWGRDPAKADELAGRFGAVGYADLDQLLSDVDAVTIAVPPDVQAELAVRAAAAGRHLLLDKPLALTVEAADRVVDAVRAAGVASIVFFTHRFHSTVDAFLTDAATRSWDLARITWLASIFQAGNPYGGSAWRREKGGLWDVGPHALSLVLPVLGPVVRVEAMAGPHDTSHVLLRHESGAVSSLTLTLDAPMGGTLIESVFYGAHGLVPVPPSGGTAVAAFGAAISQLIVAAGETGPSRHPCDVRFGREVVAILAAAEAARS
jgi:predicted dehydrogenase